MPIDVKHSLHAAQYTIFRLRFAIGKDVFEGFKGEIVKESVALGTRYSVRYEPQGMTLLFR